MIVIAKIDNITNSNNVYRCTFKLLGKVRSGIICALVPVELQTMIFTIKIEFKRDYSQFYCNYKLSSFYLLKAICK